MGDVYDKRPLTRRTAVTCCPPIPDLPSVFSLYRLGTGCVREVGVSGRLSQATSQPLSAPATHSPAHARSGPDRFRGRTELAETPRRLREGRGGRLAGAAPWGTAWAPCPGTRRSGMPLKGNFISDFSPMTGSAFVVRLLWKHQNSGFLLTNQ